MYIYIYIYIYICVYIYIYIYIYITLGRHPGLCHTLRRGHLGKTFDGSYPFNIFAEELILNA